LSLFSRRARWLQELFPASVAPKVRDPSSVSDDVSLVQQYDGGGVGFPIPTFPPVTAGPATFTATVPEVGIREFLTTVGIATSTDLILMPTGLYARILSITAVISAGTTPSGFHIDARPPTGSGIGDHIAYITHEMSVLKSVRSALPLATDLILPGHQVNAVQSGGASGTIIRLAFYWIVSPIGAIIISTGGQGGKTGI